MHRIIIRILGVSLFALLVASAPAAPGSAEATTIRDNIIVPIQGVTTNPCTGEEIAYSGDSHHVFHVTVDESGGFHGTVHINFQGASGIGLVSGDEYRIAAQVGGMSNFTGVSETTNVQNVLFVSPSPDNNFRAHYLFHYTCNFNGCSAQFIRTEVSCQG